MKFIAHRGNIGGANPAKENRMDYILEALNLGYDVEIDCWFQDSQWYLGHNEPRYKTGITLFSNPKVWCHAKNKEALTQFSKIPHCNYFWHDKDDYTFTSHRYVWCLVGTDVIPHSIAVLPELKYRGDLSKCGGICSDEIIKWKTKFADKNNFIAYMNT